MKKIWVLLSAIIVVAVMGLSIAVFANTGSTATENQTQVSPAASPSVTAPADNPGSKVCQDRGKNFRGPKAPLTEEQKAAIEAKKAEMKAKRDAQIEKWNSLTDAQKQEIYGLQDQVGNLQKQIADKYKQYGIIDDQTATDIQNKIADRNAKMKESGKIPPIEGGKGFGMGHGMRHGMMDPKQNPQTTSDAQQ